MNESYFRGQENVDSFFFVSITLLAIIYIPKAVFLSVQFEFRQTYYPPHIKQGNVGSDSVGWSSVKIRVRADIVHFEGGPSWIPWLLGHGPDFE